MTTTYTPVPFEDDGLPIGDIGAWGLEKHELLSIYANVFARSMKNQWRNRVYIDLFSGSGVARIRDTDKIVEASPLIALRVADPFTHHIFCDQREDFLNALQDRVTRLHPDAQAEYVLGDVNEVVDKILAIIPPHSSGKGTLSFCFADPFAMSNLHFDTIRKLTPRYIDFLIHIPAADPQRFAEYRDLNSEPGTAPPDIFLGSTDWREQFKRKRPSESVDMFFTRLYSERMLECGRQFGGAKLAPLIRNITDRNQRLYRLAYFSRHELGEKFWQDVINVWTGPTLF